MLTPQMQTENGHVEAGLPNEVQVKSKVGPLASKVIAVTKLCYCL